MLASLAAVPCGATILAACGSFGAAESAADAAPGETSLIETSSPPSGDGGPCPASAFCDSFDDDAGLPRAWLGPKVVGGATLNLAAGAGFNGTGGLLATLGSNATSQAAYLTHTIPTPGPPAYDAVIGFRALVVLTTEGIVLGPRFQVSSAAGDRNLSITFKKGLVRLDPNVCDAGDCNLPNSETPISAGWHRYELTLSVRPPGASPGSTLDLHVDGVSAVEFALPLLLSSPTSYAFLFGVTYTSGPAGGALLFDDASFLVTSH